MSLRHRLDRSSATSSYVTLLNIEHDHKLRRAKSTLVLLLNSGSVSHNFGRPDGCASCRWGDALGWARSVDSGCAGLDKPRYVHRVNRPLRPVREAVCDCCSRGPLNDRGRPRHLHLGRTDHRWLCSNAPHFQCRVWRGGDSDLADCEE